MNQHSPIGHNQAPDPIDEATAPFADAIAETDNWLDGEKVTTDDQMKAVDALTKDIKAALKAVNDAEKSAAAPLHDAWKAEKARFKPTIDDLTLRKNGLIAIVGDFKAKKAAELVEKKRQDFVAAERLRKEAAEKARQADAGNIEAQREALEMQQQAEDALKSARKAETVKGMRKVTKYEITDHKAALHDIAANDRDAMAMFIEEYVRRNHKVRAIAGVRVWEEREAF
jgi:hypothetical protein